MNAARDSGQAHVPGTLNADQLRALTGYKLNGPLEDHLERQGIPFFRGRNGPWTTMELLKVAGMAKLGLAEKSAGNDGEWL